MELFSSQTYFMEVIKNLLNTFLISHYLYLVSKIKPSHYELNISTIYPCGKISFDGNNRHQMEFLTKVCIKKKFDYLMIFILIDMQLPEPFHCTLLSGYKWLEISIITNGRLNPLYAIDTGNGETKNPNYINIKQKSFK